MVISKGNKVQKQSSKVNFSTFIFKSNNIKRENSFNLKLLVTQTAWICINDCHVKSWLPYGSVTQIDQNPCPCGVSPENGYE